jgi:cytochrome c oxidase subunit 2
MGPAEYTIFRDLMDTWNFWSLVVGIFTFLVMFYLIIKFREVSPDDKTPENLTPGVFPKERDNITLELTWFIVPTILVLYLTFIAWQSMISVWVDPYSEENADEAFDITIEAYQWGWNFYYHDEILIVNETGNISTFTTPMGTEITDGAMGIDGNLYLPCNQVIKAKIVTLNDGGELPVLHAPFIPEWGIKEDAVPGIDTYMAFTPKESGTYELFCAEYCGQQHSKMLAKVHVVGACGSGE